MLHTNRSRYAFRFVFLTLIVFGFSLVLVSGQQPAPVSSARPYVWTDEADGCTSIQVGRLAKTEAKLTLCCYQREQCSGRAKLCQDGSKAYALLLPKGTM